MAVQTDEVLTGNDGHALMNDLNGVQRQVQRELIEQRLAAGWTMVLEGRYTMSIVHDVTTGPVRDILQQVIIDNSQRRYDTNWTLYLDNTSAPAAAGVVAAGAVVTYPATGTFNFRLDNRHYSYTVS